MTWTRIIFEHTVKTHAMPTDYVEDIVEDYRRQGIGLHPGFPGHEITASAIVTEWGFDMGGPCLQNRPFEVFIVDGLQFSLPSDEIRQFYDHWSQRETKIRITRNGRRYHKLKGTGCLVVMPSDYTRLLSDMWARLPAAEARSEAFLLEYTQQHAPIDSRYVAPELAETLNSKRRGN